MISVSHVKDTPLGEHVRHLYVQQEEDLEAREEASAR